MGNIVIIGSGIAGHSAAVELARLGHGPSVSLLGAESGLPYDRPPLSKGFLTEASPEVPTLGPPDTYSVGPRLKSSRTATQIHRHGRYVETADGEHVHYDQLLIATGSRCRQLDLPGVSEKRIFYLRTIDDAMRLHRALRTSRSVLVIGGGFIGLEVAAAAVGLNQDVVVLEVSSRLLSRGASEDLSRHLRTMHMEKGVRIELDAGVVQLQEASGSIEATWAQGTSSFDIVVVGIGVLPNAELAADAGLDVDDGILIDSSGRTSDPHIFAAGDVTNHPIGRLERRGRTESWATAAMQGVVAARTMVGQPAYCEELPWLWSDQYDANVQCLGSLRSAHGVLLLGDLLSARWMKIGLDAQGRLVGAESLNMPREMSALRRSDRMGQAIPELITKQVRPPDRSETTTEVTE